MNPSTYKIGVDGGGTKTELVLVDSADGVIATHTVPGCNPSQCGPDGARDILLAGLNALLNAAPASGPRPPVSTLHLYMAGSPAFWMGVASTLTGYGRVVSAPDSLPVLELATNGAPGLVLHSGTGSFVAARGPDDAIYYAGGLGWKMDDAGSGYDLGRRGIARALLELQGWASPSPLGEALQTHTGLADYAANSQFFYGDPAAHAAIAGFAPRVLALAGQDCAQARLVLTESLTGLVGLARQVTTRLFGTTVVPCGVSGSVLNHEPAVVALKALAATPPWPVTLNFFTTRPIEGVRRLLAKT